MAINFKTKSNPNRDDKKQDIGFQIIFYALNFLLVPFSAIATFNGYRYLGDYLAIVLAVATGLFFLGLNIAIMNKRKKGQPHLKESLGYLLPLLISFVGNFTFFYGNQMQGELLKRDLTHYSTVLDETYICAEKSISNTDALDDLETKIKANLVELKIQMEEQGAYNGFGREAQRIWNKINRNFADYNKKYLSATFSGLTRVQNKQQYEGYENGAISYLESLKKSNQQEINKKLDPLKNQYEVVNNEIGVLLKTGNEEQLKSDGADLMKKIIKTNNKIGEEYKGYKLGNCNNEVLKDYVSVNAGNPPSAFNSAFKKWDNPSATVLSTVLSFIIDLITLGFIFIAYSYNSSGKRRRPTGARKL